MARPQDLKYTSTHEWVRAEDGVATVGITDYAIEQLGDLAFIDLPETGDTVTRGERCGEIESTKTVADLVAPISGEVVEVNSAVADDPDPVSSSPFESGWLVRIRLSEPSQLEGLLDAAGYQEIVDAEEH